MIWNSGKQLEDLLCEVVSWDSRTGTRGEIIFPEKLKNKLMKLDYFNKNRENIEFSRAGNELNALTALYKNDNTVKTIVLISHFDTVHTKEFGYFEELAFQPRELTEKFKENIGDLPESVHSDILSNEFLFGRGTMDMKMGLTLHLHLLELASIENWPINLLLVTVPDEEVDSAGMRAAVKGLIKLRKQHNLEYKLFLNSEPSFTQRPQDNNYYVYSGTIGKIMPSALFYGIETHAGEPLNGINAHYMASFFTAKMEYSPNFIEEKYGEKTPLPITLKTYDLKEEYSTQTSNHVASLYNVFLMENNAEDVMNIFRETAEESMASCQKQYEEICNKEKIKPIGKIKILEYKELINYAIKKMGKKGVEDIKYQITSNTTLDEREMSIYICDELMSYCKELAPATILFYAPPYYPAINSSENFLVQNIIEDSKRILKEEFDVDAKQVHYFNGISDLSYVNYRKDDIGWKDFKSNLPVWEDVYSIPFEGMQQLQAPVLNIGPYGKDAHKLTERLHKQSAFVQTPYLLKKIINSVMISKRSMGSPNENTIINH